MCSMIEIEWCSSNDQLKQTSFEHFQEFYRAQASQMRPRLPRDYHGLNKFRASNYIRVGKEDIMGCIYTQVLYLNCSRCEKMKKKIKNHEVDRNKYNDQCQYYLIENTQKQNEYFENGIISKVFLGTIHPMIPIRIIMPANMILFLTTTIT